MTSTVKRSVPPPALVKMGNPLTGRKQDRPPVRHPGWLRAPTALELKDAAREYGWPVITLTPR